MDVVDRGPTGFGPSAPLRRAASFVRPTVSMTTAGWLVAAGAWAVLGALWAIGGPDAISHDALLGEGRLPGPVAVAAFIGAWQLMTAAMMLPTSLPMVRLFARARRGQEHGTLALGAFLGAYFLVWTGFAVLALAGDAVLHAVVARVPWLEQHPTSITGAVLLAAGAFQFSSLKERCLDECRNALHFMWRYYRRGVTAGGVIGLRHGLFCLGCCWALMLVMFAVGVGSLAWMIVLSGVMLIEKTSSFGRRAVPVVGLVLIWQGAEAVATALLAG